MRLYKIDDNVEFPSKETSKGITKISGIRSSQRVDVRPGETVFVKTGIRIHLNKKEEAAIYSAVLEGVYSPVSGKELAVMVHNNTRNTFHIYPGQVIGRAEVVSNS